MKLLALFIIVPDYIIALTFLLRFSNILMPRNWRQEIKSSWCDFPPFGVQKWYNRALYIDKFNWQGIDEGTPQSLTYLPGLHYHFTRVLCWFLASILQCTLYSASDVIGWTAFIKYNIKMKYIDTRWHLVLVMLEWTWIGAKPFALSILAQELDVI